MTARESVPVSYVQSLIIGGFYLVQLRHLSEVSRPALVFGAGGTFCRLEWLLVSGVSSCLWGLCHCHPVASPASNGTSGAGGRVVAATDQGFSPAHVD